MTFLGFPLQTWALVCLALAVFYYIRWPRPRRDPIGPPRTALVHHILRLFHSLVWILLAAACYLWAAGSPEVASGLAALALVIYVIFLGTLLADRSRE